MLLPVQLHFGQNHGGGKMPDSYEDDWSFDGYGDEQNTRLDSIDSGSGAGILSDILAPDYNNKITFDTNVYDNNTNSGGFMSLFDSKPGGTFVGNLLRSISSGATDGILGQGKNKVNANGTKGNGDNSSWLTDLLASAADVVSKTPQGQKLEGETLGKYAAAKTSDNMLWIIVVAILGALLIFKKK